MDVPPDWSIKGESGAIANQKEPIRLSRTRWALLDGRTFLERVDRDRPARVTISLALREDFELFVHRAFCIVSPGEEYKELAFLHNCACARQSPPPREQAGAVSRMPGLAGA